MPVTLNMNLNLIDIREKRDQSSAETSWRRNFLFHESLWNIVIIGKAMKLVISIAIEEEGGVPSLERNGEGLEEMFYIHGIILSALSC